MALKGDEKAVMDWKSIALAALAGIAAGAYAESRVHH